MTADSERSGIGKSCVSRRGVLVRQIAINAGASAFFIKGVESGDFLAGVEAAADSGN